MFIGSISEVTLEFRHPLKTVSRKPNRVNQCFIDLTQKEVVTMMQEYKSTASPSFRKTCTLTEKN